MLVAVFGDTETTIQVEGLTQYDYGQILRICNLGLLDNTEVHFALQGDIESVTHIGTAVDGNIEVDIPDVHLKDGRYIRAYVYVTDEISGTTIRTITIPVKRRAAPEDMESPQNKNAIQYLRMQKADNIRVVEGELQLFAEGVPIGERARLPNVSDGREIELKNDGVAICWRYTDSNVWTELIGINELRGKPGVTPKLEIRDGHLFAVYE